MSRNTTEKRTYSEMANGLLTGARLRIDTTHAFEGQPVGARPSPLTGGSTAFGLIQRNAPYTSLAYVQPQASQSLNDYESTPVGTYFDQTGQEPIAQDVGLQSPWVWDDQGNAFDLNGNFMTTLPPPEYFEVDVSLGSTAVSLPTSTAETYHPGDLQGGFPWDSGYEPLATLEQPTAGFASGSITSSSLRHKPAAQGDTVERLHCPFGCSATFGRPGDYRRHMRKHEPPRYKCMVIECYRTFARADKLRDHMRQGHRLRLA